MKALELVRCMLPLYSRELVAALERDGADVVAARVCAELGPQLTPAAARQVGALAIALGERLTARVGV